MFRARSRKDIRTLPKQSIACGVMEYRKVKIAMGNEDETSEGTPGTRYRNSLDMMQHQSTELE